MLFNLGKCKCLHAGHSYLDVNYKVRNTILGIAIKEKNNRETISAGMQVSEQCGIAASNCWVV